MTETFKGQLPRLGSKTQCGERFVAIRNCLTAQRIEMLRYSHGSSLAQFQTGQVSEEGC